MLLLSHLSYPIILLGGTAPFHHPRGNSQSLKATKNTTVLPRFGLAVIFVGKEGNSPLNTYKHHASLIFPTLCPTPASLQGPPQSLKVTEIPPRLPNLA